MVTVISIMRDEKKVVYGFFPFSDFVRKSLDLNSPPEW